ncbi:helix-turn-helix domain-containing protein [Phytohabitans sp. LJ34]|uniref:helix-turn-helix domain-containing protein n=1 Tax=Phytohabitans sp. LJ34 TaxID=3452217 RepID=UPI003F88AB01
MTLKYIAAFLGVEFSTLARYERAEWPFRADHVAALLDVYGVYAEHEREELLSMARNAWRVCQWQVDGMKDTETAGVNDQPQLDPWWIQSRTEELFVYAPGVVPPLLQSRDYAEALLRRADPKAPAQLVDSRLRGLIGQQEILDAKPPMRLLAILEEDLLHRPIGGRLVLAAQLEHLGRVVERPHVHVRVLPRYTGWHPGLSGAFTVCQLRPPYPAVAVLEQLTGRAVLEANAANTYMQAFERIQETALSHAESMALIATIAEEIHAATPSDRKKETV